YRKSARSRELDTTPRLRRRSIRHEEGWAARWSERGSLRFAAASSAPALRRALDEAAAIPAAPEEPPDWPHRSAAAPPAAAAAPPDEPPEIFEALTNALSSASRGEATLAALSMRRGRVEERIWNAGGLDVALAQTFTDGLAAGSARRGARARESRLPFRGNPESEVETLRRRLPAAATLPLSGAPTPV